MSRQIKLFAVIAVILGTTGYANAWASDQYGVDIKGSFLKCSVAYTLIGHYVAYFKSFEGDINFNPDHIEQSQVDLKVQTKSITSKYQALDRFARSKRLLDATTYPDLTFHSKSISQKDGKLYVTGVFEMHGVSQELTFPFDFRGPFMDPQQKRHYVVGEGKWKLNRKLFNVVWDKYLDKGGLVVDDNVIIDWKVVALEKKR